MCVFCFFFFNFLLDQPTNQRNGNVMETKRNVMQNGTNEKASNFCTLASTESGGGGGRVARGGGQAKKV